MIKALAKSFKLLALTGQRSPRFLNKATKPLGMIRRFFFLWLILPAYKYYAGFKKIFNKFYAPQKIRHRLIHPFSRRFLTHTIIIVISIFTLAANLNAYETRRPEYGQTSVIAQLVSDQDLGIIEEEGPIVSNTKITRYLGETGVEATQSVSEGGQAEEILPPTIAGGSAVVSPILSPLEQELRERDKIVYYAIQNGDTISEVAEKFGITVNTILWANNLTAYSLIRPGDKLTVLPTSGIQYKIKSGDTVAKIANTYGVESEKIIEFNKLASADDIKIGEQIMIPGGKKIQAAVTPTYTFRSFTAPTPAVTQPKVVATDDMQWPNACHRISQYYRLAHSGIDIACPAGSDITAADSGKVITAQGGWNGGYGIYIIIDHGNGLQTLYGHLSKLYVKAGELVTKGQVIGAEGSTGRSTGPHLHFEVRSGGSRKNPLYYVN